MNSQVLQRSINYISSWLRFKYENEDIPGFVVAISHKGELVLNEAYGYANLERQEKLTPEHVFRIASHSKTFTATALMQLQEAGELDIDDRVVAYLPWLGDHRDVRWQKVTLRQLLSHGAGVIRDGRDADYWQLQSPFLDSEQLRVETLAADLVLDTNIKMKYSNIGYSLLGMVIETISGRSYHDYVREYIITPLKLKDTGPEYNEAIDSRLVTGYSRKETDKKRLPFAHIDTRAMAAATGFYATARDLCTYFTAQSVGTGQLLGEESKKEMRRVQWRVHKPGSDFDEDYGLGFELVHTGNRHTFGHGGGFPGQITVSLADPEDELVVVVLTNCSGGPAGRIARGIYSVFDFFKENHSNAASERNLSVFEGRYINIWAKSDIVAAGAKIVSADPDSWRPFDDPEVLEYVDERTLKIAETNSFYSEGEPVHFDVRDGTVETISYAGSTMWPEKAWHDRISHVSVIDGNLSSGLSEKPLHDTESDD